MARPKKKKLGYRKTGNLEGWCGQFVKGCDSGNNAGELVKKELGPEKCRQCTHSPRTSLAHACPLRAGWGELLLLVTVSWTLAQDVSRGWTHKGCCYLPVISHRETDSVVYPQSMHQETVDHHSRERHSQEILVAHTNCDVRALSNYPQMMTKKGKIGSNSICHWVTEE